jgi:hypothetical protein
MPRKKPMKLSATVKAAVKGEKIEPQVAELVAEFVRIAGGTKGVAMMLFDAFNAPKTSAMQKHRILQLIIYGMKFANVTRGSGPSLGLVTDEDLEREAGELILKMQGAIGGEVESQPGESA